MDAKPTHVIFIGAGAVGCFYASRLHHPAHSIQASLIARSNYHVLAADGVKLTTHSFGDYIFIPFAVFPSIDAAKEAVPKWDFVVVTTKALPDRNPDEASLIAPLVSAQSCIVLVQNGVGVEDPYRRRFPATPIVSAVTLVSAEQIFPGAVRQNRWTRIHIGPYGHPSSCSAGGGSEGVEYDTSATGESGDLVHRGSECAARLADWWTRLGGIRDVEVVNELGMQTVRWHKLTINAAMNPSAILSGGRGSAEMVLDPELRQHLSGVMREIWDAAPRVLLGNSHRNARLAHPFEGLADPDKILKSTEANRGASPSMLIDWEDGKPLELEVILGNPVRIARSKGVELPRMQSLYALLKSMQAMREGRGEGQSERGFARSDKDRSKL